MIASWGRAAAIVLLVLTALVAVLVATVWAALPLDGVSVTVDGETFSFAGLEGPRAAFYFLIAVVAIVVAILATLAIVVVGLALGALGVAFGLLATLASLALVAAPFVLIGWIVWRLLRQRPPAPAVTAAP